jgi:hypothetical protein
MSVFLDLRTSQGSSTASLTAGTPAFAGAIGLQILNATGNIRVALEVTVGIAQGAISSNTITLQILRNISSDSISSTYKSANVVHSRTFTISAGTTSILTYAAADNQPASSSTEPGQINYSLWVTASGAAASFHGPQVLIGTAVTE